MTEIEESERDLDFLYKKPNFQRFLCKTSLSLQLRSGQALSSVEWSQFCGGR